MVSLPKFKKALGNRATKTAKNIRRKSRRKPRKYRTLINTRKRVGGGYDSLWRINMATLSNNTTNDVALFVNNLSLLEKLYREMSNDKRKESERIESERKERESRGSINKSVEVEYNEYNSKFKRLQDSWEKMTLHQKQTAMDMYKKNMSNNDGVVEIIHNGPTMRFFGRFN